MEGKNVYMEDPETILEKATKPDGEKVVDSDDEE